MNILFGRLSEDFAAGIAQNLERHNIGLKVFRRGSKKSIAEATAKGIDGEIMDAVVLIYNEMSSGEFTPEEFVYMRFAHDINIIPVISEGWKGTQKVKTLLENGIYNGIYLKEFTPNSCARLLRNPRSYLAAKNYYGFY